MELRIVNGILQMDNVRIVYRNFKGRTDSYNKNGDKSFSIVIDDPRAFEILRDNGWNIKEKPARDEGDDPFRTLKVKVKFNGRGPNVILNTNGRRTQLHDDTIGMLDNIEIQHVDLDVRPYNWEINGVSGKTAYLQGMEVIQKLDRFGERAYETQDELPIDEAC